MECSSSFVRIRHLPRRLKKPARSCGTPIFSEWSSTMRKNPLDTVPIIQAACTETLRSARKSKLGNVQGRARDRALRHATLPKIHKLAKHSDFDVPSTRMAADSPHSSAPITAIPLGLVTVNPSKHVAPFPGDTYPKHPKMRQPKNQYDSNFSLFWQAGSRRQNVTVFASLAIEAKRCGSSEHLRGPNRRGVAPVWGIHWR